MPQAIRIKLTSKDSLTNGNGNDIRLMGVVERDANEERTGSNSRRLTS